MLRTPVVGRGEPSIGRPPAAHSECPRCFNLPRRPVGRLRSKPPEEALIGSATAASRLTEDCHRSRVSILIEPIQVMLCDRLLPGIPWRTHLLRAAAAPPRWAMSKGQRQFLAAYSMLLLLCTGLIIASEFLGPSVRDTILPTASDGFKTVLGALLGAMSAMLGARD
jgi:hypothetical protein